MTGPSAFLVAWSIGVLLSWVGWGRLAARWAVGRRRIDSGLCAAWGMAVLVAIGGVLNATRLCSRPVVIALTAAGIVLAMPAIWRSVRRWIRRPARRIRRAMPAVPVLLGGLFMLLASIGYSDLSVNFIDDFPFYMVMPQRMLESGAADDPLCARRLTTFGGHAFLQTQVAASGYAFAPMMTDTGLASLVVAMLLLGLPRRGAARWAVLGVVLVGWLFPWPRQNAAAGTTLTAVVLGLFRTIQLADHSHGVRRTRLLALSAAMATAAATFRANLQVLPPLFFAIYFAGRFWQNPRAWRNAAKEIMLVALVGVLTLLPWSIALYRAAGSLVYPLMHGNHRDPQFAFVPPGITAATRLEAVWQTLSSPLFVLAIAPIAVVLLRRNWRATGFYAATLAMSAATIWAFPSAWQEWQQRFCLPTLLAATLIGLDAMLRWPPVQAGIAAMVFGVLAALVLPANLLQTHLSTYAWAFNFGLAYEYRSPAPKPTVEAYAALQQTVPPGETIASATDLPLLFDFGRNPVYCIDTPGNATKVGLWPFHQGPDATRQFLLRQGVTYLAFGDFQSEKRMYSRNWWAQSASRGEPVALLMLDMMDDFDALWASSPHLYDGEGLRLIKLTDQQSDLKR